MVIPHSWYTQIVLSDFIIQPYLAVLKCGFRGSEIITNEKNGGKLMK